MINKRICENIIICSQLRQRQPRLTLVDWGHSEGLSDVSMLTRLDMECVGAGQ